MNRLSRMGLMAAMAAVAGVAMVRPDVPTVPTPTSPKMRSGKARVPSGQSFRSLRRAFNSGWEPPVVEIKPERRKLYMHSHARNMAALLELLAQRRAASRS